MEFAQPPKEPAIASWGTLDDVVTLSTYAAAALFVSALASKEVAHPVPSHPATALDRPL